MKTINTPDDLAINGAVPAFDQPLHVGRPNIGSREDFIRYIDEIFDRDWLTNNGPMVQQFEEKVADYHNVKHCVAMCNGTIALEIAIRALGLTGEVIVPSYTFIATAHALHWQGIRPVFADIDPLTHNLDPASVRSLITSETSGIIGVHLWGRPAPVEDLQCLADEYELKLMFDAAHAFGCSHNGTMIGNFGSCEVLSFHATKFFNTFEGGAVLTNDDELAGAMRLMRNFGFSGLDKVIYPGTNGKMMEIAAAMGIVNLENIKSVIDTNRKRYHEYRDRLSNIPGISLIVYDEAESNNYQYVVVEVGKECPIARDQIVDSLRAENILARKYFWPGCHNMKPYVDIYPDAKLALHNTDKVSESVIILPAGTVIETNAIEVIVSVLNVLWNKL